MTGSWVTIDERPVFIGGPGAGAGSASPGGGGMAHGQAAKLTLNSEEVTSSMNAVLDHMLGPEDSPIDIDIEWESTVKELSDISGVAEEDIIELQRAWLRMRDEDADTLLVMKQEVAGMFDIPISEHELNVLQLHEGELKPAVSRSDIRAVLGAMYEHTQQQMFADGVPDTIPLYRGTKQMLALGAQTVRSNSLSSWTADPAAAKPFSYNGRLLEIHVPRSRIFSTQRTGLGDGGEFEVIIIGNVAGFEDEVMVTPGTS